jgi:hypothetical protein
VCFETIQASLAGVVREHVASGAATERGLARATGVSQPHLHHILKGARSMTPRVADRLMRQLGLDFAELAGVGCEKGPQVRPVPLLAGVAGPGQTTPDPDTVTGSYPLPACDVAALLRPCAVRAGADPALAGFLDPGDLLLLDFGAEAFVQGSWHLAADGADCVIRRVQVAGGRYGLSAGRDWIWRPLLHLSVLDIVRARVVWIGKSLEQIPAA